MNTVTACTLDVRQIAPFERHGLIFAQLDALSAGEALQLINDHDPLPLRYQIDLQWPGQFGFTTLEAGPALWRLEICKSVVPAKTNNGACCSGGGCCG